MGVLHLQHNISLNQMQSIDHLVCIDHVIIAYQTGDHVLGLIPEAN